MIVEYRMPNGVTLVDDYEVERMIAYTQSGRKPREWHIIERKDPTIRTAFEGYVKCGQWLLHRFIMNAPTGVQVDHRDGNPLHNYHDNLRYATISQNQMNATKKPWKTGVSPSSAYKGVYWRPARQKWTARVKINGKKHYFGDFPVGVVLGRLEGEVRARVMREAEIEAARKYDEKARELFGEFARLNFS